MPGALGEENEATPPEASMILDEWGVIQGISRAERVDLMPGAAAAGKGRSSQPQSISKAQPIFWLSSVKEPFMSSSTVVEKR